MTYTTYKTNTKSPGGYESLVVFWLATTIYDFTDEFCRRFISSFRQTEQMTQAARSGKQNIAEGSKEQSIESNLKLTGVSRASYTELMEDYRDYLRKLELPIWEKEDPRVLEIRAQREFPNKSYKSYTTYMSYTDTPERFANLLITLCFKEGYLLDQLLKAIEEKFIREGGIRENLLKKRLEYRNKVK